MTDPRLMNPLVNTFLISITEVNMSAALCNSQSEQKHLDRCSVAEC